MIRRGKLNNKCSKGQDKGGKAALASVHGVLPMLNTDSFFHLLLVPGAAMLPCLLPERRLRKGPTGKGDLNGPQFVGIL